MEVSRMNRTLHVASSLTATLIRKQINALTQEWGAVVSSAQNNLRTIPTAGHATRAHIGSPRAV